MNSLFAHLLNAARIKKQEVIDDMTRNLLAKHPELGQENVLVQESGLTTGKYLVKVSLRKSGDIVDTQTAVLASSIEATITRSYDLPEYHPDYEKNEENKKLQQQVDSGTQGPEVTETEEW